MASGMYEAPTIISKVYSFSNVPVTERSGNGAYYSNLSTTDVSVSGYMPIGISLITWQGWAASATPYISSDNYINFVSDVSQTLTGVTVRVIYMKS